MSSRKWMLVAEAAALALLILAAILTYSHASRWVPFQGDESNYMFRSRFFSHLFLRRNFSESAWDDGYHLHTQPMLTNYIVGATLWLAGRNVERFPGYDWRKPYAENLRQGSVPDEATLALIRAPMIWLSVGVVVLLCALGRALGGPAAGLMAGLVGLASQQAQFDLAQARNNAPLAFFLLLALLLGVLGARRSQRGALPLWWAAATGLSLGLAFEAKLTGLLGLVATFGWAGLASLAAAIQSSSGLRHRLRSAWECGRGWLLASCIAIGVFIALDPHLWTDPVRHTAHLFEHRVDVMQDQQRTFPTTAVDNQAVRFVRVLEGSLVESTWAGSRGIPLEAAAAIAGLGLLVGNAGRRWRRGQIPSAEGLTLCTVGSYFVGVSANLYVAWAVYFLPTFLIGALLSGLGVGALARRLAKVKGRFGVERLPGLPGRGDLRPQAG
jgi:hypothetical protein